MRQGADIALRKRIPVGGGLGGGSADAALTLLGLDRLWGLNVGREALTELAAALGSDVAFFLHGGTALCEGRGRACHAGAVRGRVQLRAGDAAVERLDAGSLRGAARTP